MKLYAIAKTGLVPCVLLKSTGPYSEGDIGGFTPDKAQELIESKVVELAAKEKDAEDLGIKYVDVKVEKAVKSENTALVEAQKAAEAAEKKAAAAEAASADQEKRIADLEAELAAKNGGGKAPAQNSGQGNK